MDEQGYTLRPNALGGESVHVGPNADLAIVPAPFQRLLTPDHRAIFGDPGGEFGKLAERSRLPGMEEWFAAMAEIGECSLQIHRAEMFGTLQTDVTVRGFLPGPTRFADFRVGSGGFVRHLPVALRNVYELIDGTVEGGAFEAGGLERLSSLPFDFSSLPIGDSHPIRDLDRAAWFYASGCGDRLLADGDKAFWFLHGDCSFVEAGELSDVVDRYFQSMLTGAQWLPDPYNS